MESLSKQIAVAKKDVSATLVLKNANIVNVFTNEIEKADIAIEEGNIVGIGNYQGKTEVDLDGKYVCPGLIDGHIHIESSMLCGPSFEKEVLPHGTTTIITDPHEISNVAGLEGLDFMLETTKDLSLSVYFMLPSCVPATDLDESGATLEAEQLEKYYTNPRILGLAELMNAYGTVNRDPKILKKILDCKKANKKIDGHAPGLKGDALNAYITANVESDHECSTLEEALEKLRKGQYIMVREGTAAHNMDALIGLFKEPYCDRCMLVTDDKHPGHEGHIDYSIRKAINKGVDPIIAIKMATLIPSNYFGLDHCGAIAPGYVADLIVVDNLKEFNVESVYKKGVLVASQDKLINPKELSINKDTYKRVFHSFNMDEIKLEDLQLKDKGDKQRVVCLTPNELLTSEKIVPFIHKQGYAAGVDVEQDIIKVAVFERHHHTGHVGIGFLANYGLKKGAVATSVGHDSHNLIIAGTSDEDMMLAGNTILHNQGGLAFVVDGKVLGQLPLEVAGLMSSKDTEEVEDKLQELKQCLQEYGVSKDVDAFMTLSFVSLPVIPKLRINTHGVIDVDNQQILPTIFY